MKSIKIINAISQIDIFMFIILVYDRNLPGPLAGFGSITCCG